MPHHVNVIHEKGYLLPEDVVELWNETGLVIGDDNEPAPENIPVTGEAETPGVFAPNYGHSGLCYC
eukprot:15132494-Ditylum_brightwellii.AAC.1